MHNPFKWILDKLFAHKCTLTQPVGGHCMNVYCPVGKPPEEGWGTTNGVWVKRNPLPTTVPKGPPPIKKPFAELAPFRDGYIDPNRLKRVSVCNFTGDIEVVGEGNIILHTKE